RVRSDDLNNPAVGNQWGLERTIRASCIRWICVTAKARPLIVGNRIRAIGAKIADPLELDHCTIDFVVAFAGCLFTNRITFENTRLRGVELSGTHAKSIYAAGMEASGSVHFWQGSVAVGQLFIDGARIRGDLRCEGSFLTYSKWPEDIQLNEDTRE